MCKWGQLTPPSQCCWWANLYQTRWSKCGVYFHFSLSVLVPFNKVSLGCSLAPTADCIRGGTWHFPPHYLHFVLPLCSPDISMCILLPPYIPPPHQHKGKLRLCCFGFIPPFCLFIMLFHSPSPFVLYVIMKTIISVFFFFFFTLLVAAQYRTPGLSCAVIKITL